jgi:hypothetical protein
MVLGIEPMSLYMLYHTCPELHPTSCFIFKQWKISIDCIFNKYEKQIPLLLPKVIIVKDFEKE